MRLTIICLIASILFATCKKNNDPTKNATIPAATQEGKNTIGFTLDGEVWVPYAKCAFFNDPCRQVQARYDLGGGAAPNGIDFGFSRVRGDKSSSLTISSTLIGTVTSTGDKTDSVRVVFRGENSSGNNDYYYGPLTGSKFLITKFDRQAQIISGEFELILIEQNQSGKTITLKEGRFDFRFNACRCSE